MSVFTRVLDRIYPATSARRGHDPGVSPRRIYLHSGLPKTGSSAIQRFLAENREALLRLGYLFPEAGMTHGGGHKPLILDLIGEANAPLHRGVAEKFRRELARHPRHAAVVSSEYLSNYFARHGRDAPLLDLLLGMDLDISVIFYIRPHSDQLNSSYVQYIKVFYTDASLEDFALDKANRFHARYSQLLAVGRPPRVATVFRPYNEEVRRGGVVRDFLSTIGLSAADQAALGEEKRVNESIGPIALAAARDALTRIRRNGRNLTEQQRLALRRKLLELVEAAEPESSFYGIDDALRRAIEERVVENRENFAQAAWGVSWDAVFGAGRDRNRPCNAFDPATAEPEAMQRYRRMLDELAAAAEIIMECEKLAEVRPWDVETARASRHAPEGPRRVKPKPGSKLLPQKSMRMAMGGDKTQA
jgi:hypothetical protein